MIEIQNMLSEKEKAGFFILFTAGCLLLVLVFASFFSTTPPSKTVEGSAAERCDTQLLLCQKNDIQIRDALNNLADAIRHK